MQRPPDSEGKEPSPPVNDTLRWGLLLLAGPSVKEMPTSLFLDGVLSGGVLSGVVVGEVLAET